MGPSSFMMQIAMQDSSFLVCDATVPDLPVRHVSPGFEKMFGKRLTDCADKSGREMVGIGEDSVVQLTTAVVDAGLPRDLASAGVRRLATRMEAELNGLGEDSAKSLGFSVIVARAAAGGLMTCDVAVRNMRHPTLGWQYSAFVFNDVSGDLPPMEVIRDAAAGGGGLDTMAGARFAAGAGIAGSPRELLQSPAAINYLSGVAAKMWKDMAVSSDLFKKSSKTHASRSLASRSTASGGSCALSVGDDADEYCDIIPPPAPEPLPMGRGQTQAVGRSALQIVMEEASPESGERAVSWNTSDYEYGDLIDDLEDAAPQSASLFASITSHRGDLEASRFGAWRMRQVIQEVITKDFVDFAFPVALVDPGFLTYPVVLSSRGFAHLTGCDTSCLVGQSWQYLLRPTAPECPSAFSELRRLCEDAASGQWYPSGDSRGRAILHMDGLHLDEQLPEGELCFAHSFVTASGARSKCVSHFKQVSLDDRMYILCLQAPLESTAAASGQELDSSEVVEQALVQLWENMEVALQALAARFWLSSSLFRQSSRLLGEVAGQPLSVC
mmetsp:Transcript_57276/g.166174  ORF Transcript_57276/g.166174 Transcript_57276/m.166174 type:complete len:555 (+) Transcript_57276:96-1760(+)